MYFIILKYIEFILLVFNKMRLDVLSIGINIPRKGKILLRL